jgi:hypothetical protein
METNKKPNTKQKPKFKSLSKLIFRYIFRINNFVYLGVVIIGILLILFFMFSFLFINAAGR